jgi:hypothetical protein
MEFLNPNNGFIFRLTHISNLSNILMCGGIHCASSVEHNPNFVSIGRDDIIHKRARTEVPIFPAGMLSDYVPFYFTPLSMMMFNIITGWGILKRQPDELIIIVSSLPKVKEIGIPFVFTNQNACSSGVKFYNSLEDLRHIAWELLQRHDFQIDHANPYKQLWYQAEALVYEQLPLKAVLGIRCYSNRSNQQIETLLKQHESKIPVRTAPNLYFEP